MHLWRGNRTSINVFLRTKNDVSNYEEDVGNIDEKLTLMKQQIKEKMLSLSLNEDVYLIRYLKARLLDVPLAIKLADEYEKFRNGEIGWFSVDWRDVREIVLREVVVMVGEGVVWVRPGRWSPERIGCWRAFRAGVFLTEPLTLRPALQIAGLTVLLDLRAVRLAHLTALTFDFIKRLAYYVVECLPIWVESVHVFNEPRIVTVFLSLFKRFVRDELRKKVHFHGHGFQELKNYLPQSVLPVQLGGEQICYPSRWLDHLVSPDTLEDLRKLGYDVDSGLNENAELSFT